MTAKHPPTALDVRARWLHHKAPEHLLQQQTPVQVYTGLKHIGLSDACALVPHLSAQQWRVCADLDCWHKDTFAPQELCAWLAAFAENTPQAMLQAFLDLDDELQVLHLARTLHIYERPDVDEELVPLDE